MRSYQLLSPVLRFAAPSSSALVDVGDGVDRLQVGESV
jgi:hypothetical protein